MILTYEECKKEYGAYYRIKRRLREEKLYKICDGIYSTEKYNSELSVISAKYPNAVFTMDSAFYFHGLTDVIPDFYHLATKREASRIHEEKIKQYFLRDDLFDKGVVQKNYQGDNIRIYDVERMLVELMRNKSKLSLDYYKEIIESYRKMTAEIDFEKVASYANLFKMNQTIMNSIQLEVL